MSTHLNISEQCPRCGTFPDDYDLTLLERGPHGIAERRTYQCPDCGHQWTRETP